MSKCLIAELKKAFYEFDAAKRSNASLREQDILGKKLDIFSRGCLPELLKAYEENKQMRDRIEYTLGALNVIVAKNCDQATARAFAQTGIDFLKLGEKGCREIRGEKDPADAK